MVSAFADTIFTFGIDPAFNFEMILRWTTNVRPMDGGGHKTITMWITRLPEIFMMVKIRCFPSTYLEALSTSISSNRQWKKHFTSFKKTLEDFMTQTVNKWVKLKSKLQLKCTVNCIDQGQWILNTTADCGWFPYWFSVTYWLAEWRCSMECLVLNWFIQMKYLLAQIKIIIISYSLMK